MYEPPALKPSQGGFIPRRVRHCGCVGVLHEEMYILFLCGLVSCWFAKGDSIVPQSIPLVKCEEYVGGVPEELGRVEDG